MICPECDNHMEFTGASKGFDRWLCRHKECSFLKTEMLIAQKEVVVFDHWIVNTQVPFDAQVPFNMKMHGTYQVKEHYSRGDWAGNIDKMEELGCGNKRAIKQRFEGDEI